MARRAWVLALASVLLVGCLRPAAPTPLPAATPTPAIVATAQLPTLTPLPTPAGLLTTAEGITYTSPQHGYAIALPPGWQATVPLAQGNGAEPTPELVAWLAVPQAYLTVTALPRGGLTLNMYLEQIAAAIQTSGAQVDRAALDPTLRRDGLPAAVIEYTTADAGEPRAGYQATLIGQDADTLIVLTFTTTTAAYRDMRGQFVRTVRGVAPAPPVPTR